MGVWAFGEYDGTLLRRLMDLNGEVFGVAASII